MTHSEKRIWLIEQFLQESQEYKNYTVPSDPSEQKDLLRALMNVRMPQSISEEFLIIQDEYLQEEVTKSETQDVNELKDCDKYEGIILWQGDITSIRVDAIVNAANSQMCGCFRPLHNCVDNIIHSKSGIQLRLKCNDLMAAQRHEEPTGQAKITPAYNLPCDYVIHTVGPIVQGELNQKYEEQLASCYRSCLTLADEQGLSSIAFCCISTGVFMFPNQRAAEIALNTVLKYRQETGSRIKVVFNVFKDEDLEIYKDLLFS